MNHTTAVGITPQNITLTSTYDYPFGEGAIIGSAIFIFVAFIIGVSMNTLTIFVIMKNEIIRKNLFSCFIVSLCISDLISALISPLLWYRRTIAFDVWELPEFLCKIYWATDLMTSYVTTMHIFSFTLLRFISITYPAKFEEITRRTVVIWICVLWAVAITCGFIPFWILFGAIRYEKRNRMSGPLSKWPACTNLENGLNTYRTYQLATFPIFIFSPLLGVVILSPMIGKSVHAHCASSVISNDETLQRRARMEKEIAIQLALIVISFLIGYLPFAAYELWTLRSSNPFIDYWFGFSAYFTLRFSECLNPIFYNISSSRMRVATIDFIGRYMKCFHGSRRSFPQNDISAITS